MVRNMCISCGTMILKSAISDPYLCRDCEKILEGSKMEERYAYLDNNY